MGRRAPPPLWTAIKNKDNKTIKFLLGRDHKPHLFPEALITRSWNALSYAVSTNWNAGFDIMSTRSDLSLISPIFGRHPLHFAVAALDLDLIRYLLSRFEGSGGNILNTVPETALGHTLLDIASLQLDDSNVNMHALQIYTSIHEFRTLLPPGNSWGSPTTRTQEVEAHVEVEDGWWAVGQGVVHLVARVSKTYLSISWPRKRKSRFISWNYYQKMILDAR